MANSDGYIGKQRPSDSADEYGALLFLVRQVLDTRNHAALVKVTNVDAPRGLALAGTVDVQPLVNQLDGQGNAVAHGIVHGLTYMRAQGGTDAIIIDPKVGDIGIAVFCDRDISSVQASRAAANPGSARRSDMADGIYFGGLLNGIPTQYVMFEDTGITIKSPTLVTIAAPKVHIEAPIVEVVASTSTTITTPMLTLNGSMTATGTVAGQTDVVFAGISAKSHKHTGVSPGSSTSGGPTS